MSNILFPQSHNIAENGAPDAGEKIQVRWPDGRLYNGVFKGTNRVNMFLVRIVVRKNEW